MPQASRTRSMTSGFNGSPAPTISRRVQRHARRSSRMSIRHTVGGAQSVVTRCATSVSRTRLRVEAGVVVDEDRGARVPRREEAAPRVLRPARRADVPVHVAFTEPDPVHGGEVADRVAAVRVQHHLRLRRRAGREVEEKRVVAVRLPIRLEIRCSIGVIGDPARTRRADDDARVVSRHVVELRRALGGDDVADAAAVDAVLQVSDGQQRRGGAEDGAELHRGERDLPQLGDVPEHDEDPVSAADAVPAEEVGHSVRPFAHGREGVRLGCTVVVDNVQRGALVTARHHVEVVERPVETAEQRPGERAVRREIIVAVPQQHLARPQEGGLAHDDLVLLLMHGLPVRPCEVFRILYRGFVTWERRINGQTSTSPCRLKRLEATRPAHPSVHRFAMKRRADIGADIRGHSYSRPDCRNRIQRATSRRWSSLSRSAPTKRYSRRLL